jgi:hypothetical protein
MRRLQTLRNVLQYVRYTPSADIGTAVTDREATQYLGPWESASECMGLKL